METGCKVKTSPSILDMESGDVSLKKIREVDICDLLSRPEVRLDTEICSYLKGQTVLVTGGGGSIGSEICRQIMHYRPEKIVLFDIYENNAYTVKNQLDSNYEEKVETFIRIGTIREESRLEEVFEEFHPSIVFHAAAHKHVPLMEESPCEAIKNNIFGTYNVCNVASRYGVRKFVSLSTDKAVNPANVMGATKRVTELIVQYFDRKTSKDMQFAAVRFGNVLGSNGSVIPLFKEQLRNGGPVSVTDPKITRYFMTIPEAAQLVVQAGGLSEGGEIFVLDMGEPVKILALAENLIRLSGYRPYAEIDIIFTGLRPGEKLYEELSLKEEDASHHKTANDKIFVAKPLDFDDGFLEQCLDELRGATASQARDVLKKLVPNFIQSPDFRTIEEPIITQIGAD